MKKDELRYLQRLAEIYPTIGKASTEIINLQSILNLPKGNGTLYVRPSWGVSGVFTCAQKWFRCSEEED